MRGSFSFGAEMRTYKLIFKLDYTFLCWNMRVSELCKKLEREIVFEKAAAFTLPYQRDTRLFVSAVQEDADGRFVTLTLQKKYKDVYEDDESFVLREGENTPIKFSESFEQCTDCNEGVYGGTVCFSVEEAS